MAYSTCHCEVVFQGQFGEGTPGTPVGRRTTHNAYGGTKRSEYTLPKQSIAVMLKKGVPAKKRKLCLSTANDIQVLKLLIY